MQHFGSVRCILIAIMHAKKNRLRNPNAPPVNLLRVLGMAFFYYYTSL
jgi:hypothetical protein